MATQEVERAKAGQVPALAQTPALTIGAEDVALPRLYIGQYMSEAVKQQLVKAGSIFAATGKDDPDPQVLYDPTSNDPGVTFYVLGMRKGKSISENGELVLFDYDDPNAPEDAWVTYNYSVAVPSEDVEVPFKLLLTRTGRPAALQINTVLKKNAGRGPAWHNAFELTTAPRENKKGKFFIPRVKIVEPDRGAVAAAEKLALLVAAIPQIQPSADEPAI